MTGHSQDLSLVVMNSRGYSLRLFLGLLGGDMVFSAEERGGPGFQSGASVLRLGGSTL